MRQQHPAVEIVEPGGKRWQAAADFGKSNLQPKIRRRQGSAEMAHKVQIPLGVVEVLDKRLHRLERNDAGAFQVKGAFKATFPRNFQPAVREQDQAVAGYPYLAVRH